MTRSSAALTQLFAWLGHAYMHMLVALYLTIVLAVERAWGLPYDDLIALWTVGALLTGAGAPLAGWLGDRWSLPRMMVVFFVGTGAATAAAGLATDTWTLGVSLAAIGLFASIYHPVGFAWLVRGARRRGMAMGVLGVFGSVGVASAGIVAGLLIDTVDWRAAFIVPGAVSVLTGLVLLGFILSGHVVEHHADAAPQPEPSRGDFMRAFLVLSVTVFCGGLIYQSTQTAMPKLFDVRVGDWLAGFGAEVERWLSGALGADLGLGALGEGLAGVGVLFTLVYLVAGSMQLVGGWLADRFALRNVYVALYMFQVPLLFLAGGLAGLPLLGIVVAMVVMNTMALPAENSLMAFYTPVRWRGTAFGAKFVLSLGVTPLGVLLVSQTYGATGGFYWLFAVLAAAAVVVATAATLLPRRRAEAPAAAVPAE